MATWRRARGSSARVAFGCGWSPTRTRRWRARRSGRSLRAGWEWVAIEGGVTLVGPDDPLAEVDADALPALLRTIFVDAGGTHDDWDAYDRTMREERRTAVLVGVTRVYSNPT